MASFAKKLGIDQNLLDYFFKARDWISLIKFISKPSSAYKNHIEQIYKSIERNSGTNNLSCNEKRDYIFHKVAIDKYIEIII